MSHASIELQARPENTLEGMEATSELADDSFEGRLGAVISAIKSLAQHAISTNNESSSQQSLTSFDSAFDFSEINAVTESFDRAMRDIKRETDRASSQVDEALRMSQVSRIRGLVEGSSIQRGIDELNKLLSVESVAGKNLYQLAGANLNIPNIHCSQYDDHTHGVRRVRPTFVLKPTAKNAKIIQNAYGRALKYKLDLIQLYITCVGTDNAMSAPKRHKHAHEDDSLTMLPQKCQLGPFLDLTTVESDGSVRKKDDSTELVLAFLLPSGDCRYVEAISGSTREKAALGKHLVVPVSDGVIKLLYELYREMKASLGMKPTSSRSGARTSAPR